MHALKSPVYQIENSLFRIYTRSLLLPIHRRGYFVPVESEMKRLLFLFYLTYLEVLLNAQPAS